MAYGPAPQDHQVVYTTLHFEQPWTLENYLKVDGYAAWNLILLRRDVAESGDDLLVHELCHVWQMQHRPLAMPLSYVRQGYAQNPYEREARRAAADTA